MARLLILGVGLAAWKLRFSRQKSLVRNEAIPAFAAQRSGWNSSPNRSGDALRLRDHDKATTGRNTVDIQLSDPAQELWNAVDRAFEQWLAPSDEALDHATAATRRAGLPEIAVAPAQGRLLQVIAHSSSRPSPSESSAPFTTSTSSSSPLPLQSLRRSTRNARA